MKHIHIPEDAHKTAKAEAAREGISIPRFVALAIEAFVKQLRGSEKTGEKADGR